MRIKVVSSEDHDELARKGLIDVEEAKRRCAEYETLLTWTREKEGGEEIASIIIGGDFNNYRRDTPVEQWNINQVKTLAEAEGFTFVSPECGGSIKEARPRRGVKDECAEDHFLVRGLRCEKLFDYDRDFAKGRTGVDRGYMLGSDLIGVPEGLPDHAILRGEFVIAEASRGTERGDQT